MKPSRVQKLHPWVVKEYKLLRKSLQEDMLDWMTHQYPEVATLDDFLAAVRADKTWPYRAPTAGSTPAASAAPPAPLAGAPVAPVGPVAPLPGAPLPAPPVVAQATLGVTMDIKDDGPVPHPYVTVQGKQYPLSLASVQQTFYMVSPPQIRQVVNLALAQGDGGTRAYSLNHSENVYCG